MLYNKSNIPGRPESIGVQTRKFSDLPRNSQNNTKYNKVASAMLTNLELVKLIAKEKKLTFISTGMCSMSDIEKAVKIFVSNKCKYVLMHSVSLYPCEENLLNLKNRV